MGTIRVDGTAPFDLGIAQRTTAEPLNGAVELTVYVNFAEHGPDPKPVKIRMTKPVALEAAAKLAQAASPPKSK